MRYEVGFGSCPFLLLLQVPCIIALKPGRMAMIRPWLSANFLGSKARASTHPLVRYNYFEPETPSRRPSDLNKQNPLLNLLRSGIRENIWEHLILFRSNMRTFGPLIKRAWHPNFIKEEKQKKKFEILRFGK